MRKHKQYLRNLIKTGNKLQKAVAQSILSYISEEYVLEKYLTDVLTHGCCSGLVSELIYYRDTLKFYKKYQVEINELLAELLSSTGCTSPAELFGNKWDEDDPLVLEVTNHNLLAWFGYEETCRQIGDELELEI